MTKSNEQFSVKLVHVKYIIMKQIISYHFVGRERDVNPVVPTWW